MLFGRHRAVVLLCEAGRTLPITGVLGVIDELVTNISTPRREVGSQYNVGKPAKYCCYACCCCCTMVLLVRQLVPPPRRRCCCDAMLL